MRQLIKRIVTVISFSVILLFIPDAQLFAQEIKNITVSINSSGKPLHMVLDDLANQTGYYFTFDSRLTDSHQEITISLADISIQQAIDTLFQDHTLQYKLINKNIVLYPGKRITAPEKIIEFANNSRALEIHGIIKDIKSDKPLPYATISVLDTYYGTISNEDGSFILRLPESLDQIILVASFIGYKNHYQPISLNSEEPVEISMNKTVISLQEVIIRYQDPVSLLTESLNRISNNYMKEPAGMTAYYREKVRKDDKCMVFSEAVVEIAKAPYSNSMQAERTRLLKGRTITNIDIQDTVIFKIRSGLNSMLQLDIIKNIPDFLSPDFVLNYNLHFSSVVSFKDKLVYVISFQQKETIQDLLFRGDLYIDRETLAIIAADFEYDPMRIQREEDMFVAKKSNKIRVHPLNAQYHVEYTQTGAGYHLSQVQGEVKFKVRRRRQWIASRYQINIEMAVTNVDPGNPPDIKFNQKIKPASILADQNFQYDPGFWGDYTIIAPETSLSDALNRIEKSILEIKDPSSVNK